MILDCIPVQVLDLIEDYLVVKLLSRDALYSSMEMGRGWSPKSRYEGGEEIAVGVGGGGAVCVDYRVGFGVAA